MRINNPLFSEPKFEKVVIKTFFHEGPNDQLYFFAERNDKKIKLFELDSTLGDKFSTKTQKKKAQD